eukprot:scaffold424_cov162-Amphora_coffeaeformis.AAC.11
MTELEYFGQGRFLLMRHNTTPHLTDPTMLSGGSLKDGWSYIVPTDQTVMQTVEVNVAFADEMSDHVREQTQALRSLYLPSTTSLTSSSSSSSLAKQNVDGSSLTVKQEDGTPSEQSSGDSRDKHFVVQRGHQVVAVATYSHATGELKDVAVQPSAKEAREALVKAVQHHARKLNRSGSLVVHPRTAADEEAFVDAGFRLKDDDTATADK